MRRIFLRNIEVRALPGRRSQGLMQAGPLTVPVVLGRGTKLFGEGAGRRELALVEAREITPNLLLLRYAPASDGGATGR